MIPILIPLCAPVPDTFNVGLSINLWNSDDPKIPHRKYIQVFLNHSGLKTLCPRFQFMRNKNKNWWISINMGDLTTSLQIRLNSTDLTSTHVLLLTFWAQWILYPVCYYVCPASLKFRLSALLTESDISDFSLIVRNIARIANAVQHSLTTGH